MISSLIWLVVVGLVAGFIARAVVPGKDAMSVPMTIALGIVGSVVGGFLLGVITVGLRDRGFGPSGIIGSIIGAVIVLLAYNRFVATKHGRGAAHR